MFDGDASSLQDPTPPLKGDNALTQPWRQNENAYILPIPRALRQDETEEHDPEISGEIVPITPARVPALVDSPLPIEKPIEKPAEEPAPPAQPIVQAVPKAQRRDPRALQSRPPDPPPNNARQTRLLERPNRAPQVPSNRITKVIVPKQIVAVPEPPPHSEGNGIFIAPEADLLERVETAPPIRVQTAGKLLKDTPAPLPPQLIPPTVLLPEQQKKRFLFGIPLLFLAVILLFVFAFIAK
jgi:hypothetical protein